jgi:chromate transporter
MMLYFRLFLEFFKTGLFSFGGGLATVPFLNEMAVRTNWFTSAQLADMIAVSESTPGPIGINMATYVGYTSGGILGAVVAVLGIITPAIIVIVIIAGILEKFRSSTIVEAVFTGLRPASVAMIAAAGLEVVRISLLDIDTFKITGSFLDLVSLKGVILAVALYFAIKKFKGHPVFYILGSAIVGIVFKLGA